MSKTAGKLWVVATPIGNLEDFSHRAQAVLQSVDLIAAEDTRHSQPLLARYGITTRTLALHDHNEQAASERLVELLSSGTTIALISDAGTPLVSDPGFRLVRAARAAGIAVSPVPGPCAAVAALSIAGLPSDRFVFEGFLPAKTTPRQARLVELCTETRTLIFYESSHRIVDAIVDIAAIFGAQRQAVVGRELTKLYETVLDGTLADLLQRVQSEANQQRGEFVLVVAGAPESEAEENLAEGRRVFDILRAELPPSQAAKLAAAITGASRKRLYEGG